jgi:hypothetical protein
MIIQGGGTNRHTLNEDWIIGKKFGEGCYFGGTKHALAQMQPDSHGMFLIEQP